MKLPGFHILLLCLCALQSPAATTSENPRLAGIINLPGIKQALVQNVRAPTGSSFALLREGEREGDMEVIEIHPDTATVKARMAGNAILLRMKAQTNAAAPTIALEQADLMPVLRWHAQLTKRNFLRSPALPGTTLTLSVIAADNRTAALKIEQALAEEGIAVVPDGEKFVLIVPREEAKALGGRPHPPDARAKSPGDDVLPPGMIFLSGVDARQVMSLYAELVARQFEQGETFKVVSGSMYFLNQTPLTREEVRYALDTLFAWHGFEVIPVGEKGLKCVAKARPADQSR